MKSEVLAIMARRPEPGQVKTRLGLPPSEAVTLCAAFLHDLVRRHRGRGYDLVLAVHPPEEQAAVAAILGTRTLGQEGRDLGERMRHVFRQLFCGYRKVAVVGSDAPQVDHELVRTAFRALDRCDVVLGPALDGGYYLIAMKRELSLFEGVAWSTPDVLQQTLCLAADRRLHSYLLPPLRDIDTLEDLKALRGELDSDDTPATREAIHAHFRRHPDAQ